MARIFITGSADGLGQLSARRLTDQGHQIVLHARSPDRARQAWQGVPGAEGVVVGDLSDPDAIRAVAHEVNASGPFDTVIHNAGVYQASPQVIWTVNVIAPYVLTCLINRPRRLVYLSSGMHLSGRVPEGGTDRLNRVTYADSKLDVLLLCMAMARTWPEVHANAVDPGWVPTKMGGVGAPDDLQQGAETQAWLAVSDEAAAKVSGRYFYHRRERPFHPLARDAGLQTHLLELCEETTGVRFPAP